MNPIRRLACMESWGCPPMRISPSSGITKPVTALIVVVLPAPLGPRKPKISPFIDLEIQALENRDRPLEETWVKGLAEIADPQLHLGHETSRALTSPGDD